MSCKVTKHNKKNTEIKNLKNYDNRSGFYFIATSLLTSCNKLVFLAFLPYKGSGHHWMEHGSCCILPLSECEYKFYMLRYWTFFIVDFINCCGVLLKIYWRARRHIASLLTHFLRDNFLVYRSKVFPMTHGSLEHI